MQPACYRASNDNIFLACITIQQGIYHCHQSHEQGAALLSRQCCKPGGSICTDMLFNKSTVKCLDTRSWFVGMQVQYWQFSTELGTPVRFICGRSIACQQSLLPYSIVLILYLQR